MVTRLLLLAAFVLGLIPPPTDGHAQHCADPGVAAEMGSESHHGHGGSMPTEPPAEEGDDQCPPEDCAMVVHCAQALGDPETTRWSPNSPRTSHFAPRTASVLAGRHLEPPTPPPNRSL